MNKDAKARSNLSSTIMKTLLLVAFALTTALAQFANAAKEPDQDQVRQPKKQQQAAIHRQAPVTQTPKSQPKANVRPQTPVYRAPQVNPMKPHQGPQVRSYTPKVRSYPDQDVARANRLTRNPDMMPRVRPNQNVVTTPHTTATVHADRRRSDLDNRDRTNKNWQNRVSHHNNNSWEQARRRHHRNHHHRSWWRSHFTRFALFGSGYYYWDNGYWFPAYGYDSTYNTYSYDEPIYGYNDLDPAQVIANVQTELQRLGYYRYAVDGQMGPMTRAAIANYQRDNGLSITAAIDEPTLGSLGLE